MRKRSNAQARLNEQDLADLVKRSRDGDVQAWKDLWLALAPRLEAIAGRWWVTGRLSRCRDEQRNVVVRVMGELRKDDFRLLGELGERLAEGGGAYERWFPTIAIHSALKHVRAHPDYVGRVEGEAGRWARLAPLTEALKDDRVDPTHRVDAHSILAYARETLDAAQYDALCEWLRGDDFDEIAGALELDGGAAAARRLVRSALWHLRSRFAGTRGKKIDRCR